MSSSGFPEGSFQFYCRQESAYFFWLKRKSLRTKSLAENWHTIGACDFFRVKLDRFTLWSWLSQRLSAQIKCFCSSLYWILRSCRTLSFKITLLCGNDFSRVLLCSCWRSLVFCCPRDWARSFRIAEFGSWGPHCVRCSLLSLSAYSLCGTRSSWVQRLLYWLGSFSPSSF